MSDLDLENRLRADAARRNADDYALLDFDEAFDLVTHDEKHERTRRSALRWAAAAAAVVTIAGVAAAVAWKSPTHRTTLATPPTVTYRGHVYETGPTDAAGVFRDARDPARIDLLVRTNTDSAKYQCWRVRPAAEIVRETATEVLVRSTIYSMAPRQNVACLVPGLTYQPVRLMLAQPLGTRMIVNTVDRSAVPVLDPADLPVPAYLPAGFRPAAVARVRPGLPVLASTRSYHRGESSVTVTVIPGYEVDHQGATRELVTEVAGTRAELYHDENGRCLTWPTRPGIARQVCSNGASVLSAAELVKIARSLH